MEQDKTRLLKFFEHAWTIVFVKSHRSLAIIYLSNYDNIHTHTVKREEITMLYEHKKTLLLDLTTLFWTWIFPLQNSIFPLRSLRCRFDNPLENSRNFTFLFFNILNPLSFSLLLKVFAIWFVRLKVTSKV